MSWPHRKLVAPDHRSTNFPCGNRGARMTSLLSTSYDEIPYESFPLYSAHPNLLAVAGRLRGIEAAAPSQCRMLELGCGNGGNLIPVAYGLPNGRFVGVDLSQRQIEEGQGICRQLELSN